VITTSIRVVGALGFDGMANRCELPINAVKANKPKMLRGLNQKVRDRYEGIQFPSSETTPSPANRQGPEGAAIEEDGESERSFVMKGIGVAPFGNITLRKSGQTSVWSFITRTHE